LPLYLSGGVMRLSVAPHPSRKSRSSRSLAGSHEWVKSLRGCRTGWQAKRVVADESKFVQVEAFYGCDIDPSTPAWMEDTPSVDWDAEESVSVASSWPKLESSKIPSLVDHRPVDVDAAPVDDPVVEQRKVEEAVPVEPVPVSVADACVSPPAKPQDHVELLEGAAPSPGCVLMKVRCVEVQATTPPEKTQATQTTPQADSTVASPTQMECEGRLVHVYVQATSPPQKTQSVQTGDTEAQSDDAPPQLQLVPISDMPPRYSLPLPLPRFSEGATEPPTPGARATPPSIDQLRRAQVDSSNHAFAVPGDQCPEIPTPIPEVRRSSPLFRVRNSSVLPHFDLARLGSLAEGDVDTVASQGISDVVDLTGERRVPSDRQSSGSEESRMASCGESEPVFTQGERLQDTPMFGDSRVRLSGPEKWGVIPASEVQQRSTSLCPPPPPEMKPRARGAGDGTQVDAEERKGEVYNSEGGSQESAGVVPGYLEGYSQDVQVEKQSPCPREALSALLASLPAGGCKYLKQGGHGAGSMFGPLPNSTLLGLPGMYVSGPRKGLNPSEWCPQQEMSPKGAALLPTVVRDDQGSDEGFVVDDSGISEDGYLHDASLGGLEEQKPHEDLKRKAEPRAEPSKKHCAGKRRRTSGPQVHRRRRRVSGGKGAARKGGRASGSSSSDAGAEMPFVASSVSDGRTSGVSMTPRASEKEADAGRDSMGSSNLGPGAIKAGDLAASLDSPSPSAFTPPLEFGLEPTPDAGQGRRRRRETRRSNGCQTDRPAKRTRKAPRKAIRHPLIGRHERLSIAEAPPPGRRSGRVRTAPIDYWKVDRVEYDPTGAVRRVERIRLE